jgi:hypothetical protein
MSSLALNVGLSPDALAALDSDDFDCWDCGAINTIPEPPWTPAD